MAGNNKKFIAKNGLLTQNIEYLSPDRTNSISVEMLDSDTLSWEGNSGQLFSITDSLTGTIFSVNDISGIPSIEVDDDGTIRLAEFAGSVLVGTGNDNGTDRLQVSGSIEVSSISKSGTNGSGNIGSSSNSFNTVHAKATSAQYADVAENYASDDSYTPGTVMIIGGTEEVTISSKYADSKLAGVITTNPAMLMNDDLQSKYIAPIALTGRVPCAVVGTIKKGDVLTTSHILGVATRLFKDDFVPGCVIGKALQSYDNQAPGVIEVLVGKV